MLSAAEQLKFLALGAKYNVQVIDQQPGYVKLTIGTWNQHAHQFKKLIEELKQSTYVDDIFITFNMVEIYYKPDIVNHPEVITALASLITKYA